MTPSTLTLDPTAELQACLDRATGYVGEGLDAEGLAELLRAVTRAEVRLAAWRLQILSVAERTNVAAASGAASTGQWVAHVANSDHASAHRQVGLATGLERRIATQDALARGAMSPAHAAVIVQADRQLPPMVTTEQRAVVEKSLIAKAQTLSPAALRKAARRALDAVETDLAVIDAHENQLVANLEERARAQTRLTLHDNGDGTVTGHFTIPVLQGHLLRKILETITAPRRGRLGATQAQVGDREARTDCDRARGEAFCELVEHLPTEHLHPKTAATLVVALDESVLRDALKVAHLDTDETLSAGEARRLACGSGLIPIVLGGRSVPLDLGRRARLFSDAPRTALGVLHNTCAADGCERPFAWCELHHEIAWSHGGTTDLRHATPLCHFHHRRIHDPYYQHTRGRDGGLSFHRRT